MLNKSLTGKFDKDINALDSQLRLDASYDLIGRNVKIAGRRAKLYLIDGFCKDELMQKIIATLMDLAPEDIENLKTARDFASSYISYVETDIVADMAAFEKQVLSGAIGVIIEGFSESIIIDARTYPVRSVGEPENDRVLRGPHDGFVETVVFNSALIRRRIRDVNLTMEAHSVGTKSQSDVVICYMNGTANEK